MKMKNLRKSRCVAITFFVIIIWSTASYANDYFGILQFTDPKSGLKRIVFQRSDSKRFCEILNEDFWSGVKTSCPNCLKDFSIVSESVPAGYRGIYQNKPIVFPYLSSKEDRIIFFGIPMKDAIQLCETFAEAYRTKLNRPAKAILPINMTSQGNTPHKHQRLGLTMTDRLLEAVAKGILAGIIGLVVYGIYYLILKISKRKKDKIKER